MIDTDTDRNKAKKEPNDELRLENISNRQIWLALNQTDASYHQLFQATANLPLPEDSGFVEGEGAYAVAVNVAAMAFLIHQNPQIFAASHGPRKERPHCVGITHWT